MILNDDYWAAAELEAGRDLKIMCFDPGDTTGWVFAHVDHRLFERGMSVVAMLKCSVVHHGQIGLERESGQALYRAERYACNRVMNKLVVADGKWGLDFVVIEDFVLRERTQKRNLLSPVRLTAGMHNDIDDSDLRVMLHIQSPSDKSDVTDEELDEANCWFKGEQHARDAARHLILFMRRLIIS
jgi:hypothetical protein